MKNPNGYGSVFKLSGNRRRPFVARKTIGFNEKGHPVYFVIGYYAKRSEAMRALANFNGKNINLSEADWTLLDVFKKWEKECWNSMSRANQYAIKNGYKWIKHLENKKYRLIKLDEMQAAVDSCPLKTSAKKNIIKVFHKLDEVAERDGIIDKRMSKFLKTEIIPASERQIFTFEEIKKIMECKEPFAEIVLIYLLTGFRRTELLTLKTKDIHIEERYVRGGVKTKAGKDRVVPIHSRLIEIFKKRTDFSKEYFLEMKIGKFRIEWKRLMQLLKMNHIAHECRHTFRSLLDSADGNRKCINLIMGHSNGEDMGERIYTHKTIKELIDTVDLIKI